VGLTQEVTMQRQSIPGNSAGPMNGDGSRKALIHTTEGPTIAGAVAAYRANNSWPHKTVDLRRRLVAEHLALSVAARSLQNLPGGADQTNKDGDVLIQYELVGSATNPASIGSPEDLDWFGREVLGPDCRAMGVPLVTAVKWIAYRSTPPSSYGRNNGVRLSPAEWDAYSGVLGHQHAPDNVHGDPGAIDINRILSAARGDDDMAMTAKDRAAFIDDISDAVITKLNRQLRQQGSVIRTVLAEKTEDGIEAALAEGHELDERLDALVEPDPQG
jgi:hypothetical protein